MIFGLFMLALPITVYIATFSISRRLKPLLCAVYRIAGGLIVIGGSAISLYLAGYTGDQGGISAHFFQLAVIWVYVVFSAALLLLNTLFRK